MALNIRPYQPEDEAEWMRVHAQIMTQSHAWNYCIQERPAYAGHPSTRLVAERDGRIVALTDAQYENQVGELCFRRDTPGGYVLEFGRLPEAAGHGIGKRLIDATIEDARRLGYHRLEYWSQDRGAQQYYQKLGLEEIGRHFRFRFRAPQQVQDRLMGDKLGVEYVYGVCVPEEWPIVKEKYDIVWRHPLEPHLCIGYEIRF